ncbi:glycosyltransferase [Pirellulales bacterium]|nr:glycosyltransferase [Pirellulales bacterium]
MLRSIPRPVCELLLAILQHVPTVLGTALRYPLVARLSKRCGQCVAVHGGVHLRGLANIEFGDHVSIHPMSYIEGAGGLSIGSNVSVAHGVSIMTTEHDFSIPGIPTRDAPVLAQRVDVGDDVWIGCGARVLGGVTLGEGAVVGAGAVVTKSASPRSVVAGVPARVVREETKAAPLASRPSTVESPVHAIKSSPPSVLASRRPRVCYVITSPASTKLLRGQLASLRKRGFDVDLVCSPGRDLEAYGQLEGVRVHALPMQREINLVADLRALMQLVRLLRATRPDVVNASTPKAGLLGMLAARLAGVPVRIYVLRGLRLEATARLKRKLLASTERIASKCSDRVVCVSESLRDAYLRLGLTSAKKVAVIGAGSSNGVEVDAFACRDSDVGRRRREQIRRELKISDDAVVYGAVGRLNRDKGIVDLLLAFERVSQRLPNIRLLLVGDFEAGDPLPSAIREQIATDDRILQTGFVADAKPYYYAMDALVHASVREGFPNVVLEAAAAELPTIGRRVTGVVDAIADGATGLVVDPVGPLPLAEGMFRYGSDQALACRHGSAGRRRVETEFLPQAVWDGLADLYAELLTAKSLPAPVALWPPADRAVA